MLAGGDDIREQGHTQPQRLVLERKQGFRDFIHSRTELLFGDLAWLERRHPVLGHFIFHGITRVGSNCG